LPGQGGAPERRAGRNHAASIIGPAVARCSSPQNTAERIRGVAKLAAELANVMQRATLAVVVRRAS